MQLRASHPAARESSDPPETCFFTITIGEARASHDKKRKCSLCRAKSRRVGPCPYWGYPGPSFCFLVSQYTILQRCGGPINVVVKLSVNFFRFKDLFVFIKRGLAGVAGTSVMGRLTRRANIRTIAILTIIRNFVRRIQTTRVHGRGIFLHNFNAFLVGRHGRGATHGVAGGAAVGVPTRSVPTFGPSPTFRQLLRGG